MADIKKNGPMSNWKLRGVVAHRNSVAATGGGAGAPALTPQEERVAAIIGETLIAGLLPASEGDSNIHPGRYEIHQLRHI